MGRSKAILLVLILSTLLGGDSANYDTTVLRVARVIVLLPLPLFINPKAFNAITRPGNLPFVLFIVISIIVILYSNNHIMFGLWKLYEVLIVFVVVASMNLDRKTLFNFFLKTVGALIILNLFLAIFFPHLGFLPIGGSVLSVQLRGTIFTMNANDVGFWSALLFLLSNNKTAKILFATSLLLSQSRIYVGLTLIILFFKFNNTKRFFLIFISLIAVFLYEETIIDFFIRTTNPDELLTLNGRLNFSILGLEVWQEKPLLGWGFYTGIRYLGDVHDKISFYSNTFDNGLVDILVSSGLFGAVFFIGLLTKCFNSRLSLIASLFLLVRFLTGPGLTSFTLQFILLIIICYGKHATRFNRL